MSGLHCRNNRLRSYIITIVGTTSFVSDHPWVSNKSVRENIIFGREYDPKWYAEVIRCCCLEPDFDSFPSYDMTEIGERGINLSGKRVAPITLCVSSSLCSVIINSRRAKAAD
jgi:ABC-type transport system involved in cytochrome bd biosynthesis fused ATPase/permease subunit